MSWYETLAMCLSSGLFGSVATALMNRRKTRQDFLSSQQQSIDLLSERNTQLLEQNVRLKEERVEWEIMRRELLVKIDRLKKERELLQKIDTLQREVECLRDELQRKQHRRSRPAAQAVALLTAAMLMLTGCGAVHHTARQNSDVSILQRSDIRSTDRVILAADTTVWTEIRRREYVPEAHAGVTLPVQALAALPDGAGYHAREGRATVRVERRDSLVYVTAGCDSVAREAAYYRRQTAMYRRMAEEAVQHADSVRQQHVQDVREKRQRREGLASWQRTVHLLAGFLAGIALTVAIHKRNNILTLFKNLLKTLL
ncbi:MAG: hypothetical protein K6F98_05660 [Bacteroidales bacterium]|nr:hypothetical protein [Bacteroidales bacterium]